MTLADGRRLAFGIACVEAGEASPFDGRPAQEPTLEIWALAAGSRREHPEFLACRFTASSFDRHARSEHSRHGLPLRAAQGVCHLSPEDSRWLLSRLSEGRLEEIEITPTPRQRLSPLAV
jgi:hypothetical protein